MSSDKATTRYFFRYRAPSRIAFSSWIGHQREKPNGIRFDFVTAKVNVVLFDEGLPTEPKLHYGIGFDLEVEHDNPDQAQLIARSIVAGLIAVLSFCERCYVGRPEFVARYRIPENGKTLQEALAYVLDRNYAPVEISLRMIGFDRFREIFNKIHAISDENSRNTILRSLNWFWMSLDNNLDVDNFLHLWIGVELLEPELKSHYGFDSNKWANPRCRHCKREFESCPNCSGDFTYAAGSGALGLKQVVADCGMKANLYRDLQGLRSKLVHAGIPIPQEIIQQAIVDTRELLTKAIFTLLDLDHTRTSGLSSIVRHQSNPLLFFFEGTMDVVDVPTIDDVHLQPTVYGRYDYNFEIDDHGDLVFRGEVEHEFQGAFIGGSMEKKLRVDSSLNVQDVWDES